MALSAFHGFLRRQTCACDRSSARTHWKFIVENV